MTFRSPFIYNFNFLYTFTIIKVIWMERGTSSNELTKGKADPNDCKGRVPISNHTTKIREAFKSATCRQLQQLYAETRRQSGDVYSAPY